MGRVHRLVRGWTMKPSRFTEEQIIAILREQEAGAATADVCRKHGVSEATFYKWKAKFSGLEVSDALPRQHGWVGLSNFQQPLSKETAVYWPHDLSRQFVDPTGVCVRTMHSAKGLQWRAVLVMRCDMMPFLAGPNVDRAEQERLERGLM